MSALLELEAQGDLAKFIERAVQKEVFARTVTDIQARNAKVPDEQIEEAIEDVLARIQCSARSRPYTRPIPRTMSDTWWTESRSSVRACRPGMRSATAT